MVSRHAEVVAVGHSGDRDAMLPSPGNGFLNGHAAGWKSKAISRIDQHGAGTLVFNHGYSITYHTTRLEVVDIHADTRQAMRGQAAGFGCDQCQSRGMGLVW